MTERLPSMAGLAAAVLASEHAAGTDRRVLQRAHAGLAKVMGSNGVDALMARALRLAQRSEARLSLVTLADGGALDGLPAGAAEPLLLAILTQLFELVARFIGDDLTRRLLAETWPGVVDVNPKEETKS